MSSQATGQSRPKSKPDPSAEPQSKVRLRVLIGTGIMLGPGRADLLEGIGETGSIAAAGRRMGMSYKRAWSLVEVLNSEFPVPLVAAVKGGAGGGGSALTELGEEVLRRYRHMQKRAEAAVKADVEALWTACHDISKRR